jgi:hypothetical protein
VSTTRPAFSGGGSGLLDALGQRTGFVFGETASPFNYDVTYDRALRVWNAAKLEPVCLHECRHTYVTLMFEAGLSLEEIGDLRRTQLGPQDRPIPAPARGPRGAGAERFDAFLAATGARTGAFGR